MKRVSSESEQPAKKAKNSKDSNQLGGAEMSAKMPTIPSPAEIQKRLEAARAQVQKSLPTKSDQVSYTFLFIKDTGYEISTGS